MELILNQRKIVRFLRECMVEDSAADRSRPGYRSLDEIKAGTGLGDGTVRRHTQALYKGLYLKKYSQGMAVFYRATDGHEV